jgi:predicted transcriptional regulator
MSYGYSTRLVKANQTADKRLLGVRLGKMCIREEISVSSIAEELGVSRQTIYNWFSGTSSPTGDTAEKVEAFIKKYFL